MTTKDEVARRVAERLGMKCGVKGGAWTLRSNGHWTSQWIPRPVWDALISAEMRANELQEALRNLLLELDSKGPAYDPSMRKLAIDRARAAQSAKEKI